MPGPASNPSFRVSAPRPTESLAVTGCVHVCVGVCVGEGGGSRSWSVNVLGERGECECVCVENV